jgi:hypothetical protein
MLDCEVFQRQNFCGLSSNFFTKFALHFEDERGFVSETHNVDFEAGMSQSFPENPIPCIPTFCVTPLADPNCIDLHGCNPARRGGGVVEIRKNSHLHI